MATVKIQPKLAFRKVTSKKDRMGRLINWWCDSKYFHVELILEDKWISSTPKDNIYINDLKPLDHESYDYVTLRAIEIDHNVRADVWKFLRSIEGTKYDMFGLLHNQVIGANSYSDKYFCSEVVVETLQYLGYGEVFGSNGAEYTPQDIYNVFTQDNISNIVLRKRAILVKLRRVIKSLKEKWKKRWILK